MIVQVMMIIMIKMTKIMASATEAMAVPSHPLHSSAISDRHCAVHDAPALLRRRARSGRHRPRPPPVPAAHGGSSHLLGALRRARHLLPPLLTAHLLDFLLIRWLSRASRSINCLSWESSAVAPSCLSSAAASFD